MKTATEIQFRLHLETKKKLLDWFRNEDNIIGKQIELSVTHFEGGELGTVTCEIKGWKPT